MRTTNALWIDTTEVKVYGRLNFSDILLFQPLRMEFGAQCTHSYLLSNKNSDDLHKTLGETKTLEKVKSSSKQISSHCFLCVCCAFIRFICKSFCCGVSTEFNLKLNGSERFVCVFVLDNVFDAWNFKMVKKSTCTEMAFPMNFA